MNLGLLLRVVRDQLRRRFHWQADQCRVTPDGSPLEGSGSMFVGIVDGGIQGSRVDGYFHEEVFQVDVAVWRRTDGWPDDRLENTLLDEDRHVTNVALPSELERQIKRFLHFNYGVMNCVNQQVSQCAGVQGGLIHPLIYQGSDATKLFHSKSSGQAWAGRLLHFGGAVQVDPISQDEN